MIERADRRTAVWQQFYLQAWGEGRDARFRGTPMTANPYIDPGEYRSLSDNWEDGWNCADRILGAAPRRVIHLRCACCDSDAPAYAQCSNQDTGYGVCTRCFNQVSEKEGRGQAIFYYGQPGIHHSIDAED